MKTLLFILLSLGASAQSLENTTKIIYRSVGRDTVSVHFQPFGSAILTVKTTSETIDDAVEISGEHVLKIALDTLETITVKVDGIVNYRVVKNGVDVTPSVSIDSSLIKLKQLLISCEGVAVTQLTTAQVRALVALLMYREGIIDESLKVKKLKQILK